MPAENYASNMASGAVYFSLFVAVIVITVRIPKHLYAFFRSK